MPPDIEAVAEQVFIALAAPTRRSILAALASEGPATATDLADRLPITRQAVAQPPALLADVGLVTAETGGGAGRRGGGRAGGGPRARPPAPPPPRGGPPSFPGPRGPATGTAGCRRC